MSPVGRRFRRGAAEGTWAEGEDDGVSTARDLADRHLLLVPSTVTPDQVHELLRDRITGADLLGTGSVQLGRYSRFSGPYHLAMEDAVDAAVPIPWTVAYALTAPHEREDPPPSDLDDRDGFAFAFPRGMPWREEGRGLHLLVSLARRLHGVVRTTGSLELIQPDPDRAVDFCVHAPLWVDPEVMLGIVSRVVPGARLAVEGADWAGPPPEAYSGEAIAADTADDPLSGEELRQLHASADAVDLQVLGGEDVLDAYAIVAELGAPGPAGVPSPAPARSGRHSLAPLHGQDGAVEVLAHIAEDEEPSTTDQPWAGEPFVTYEIRWASPDPVERESRLPSAAFLASRARVKPVVAAVTSAVVEATSGVVVDEDGFRFDRYLL